ncbi:hypothetical protein HWV62_30264 [Athelia sp. TMB]|nr:hypothetical protein HWV62_30264 [Athelia sp. TMB]
MAIQGIPENLPEAGTRGLLEAVVDTVPWEGGADDVAEKVFAPPADSLDPLPPLTPEGDAEAAAALVIVGVVSSVADLFEDDVDNLFGGESKMDGELDVALKLEVGEVLLSVGEIECGVGVGGSMQHQQMRY